MLLAYPLGYREIAPGENTSEVAGDDAVVVGREATPPQGVDVDLEGRANSLAGGVDGLFAGRRCVAVGELQNLALGSGEEVLPVHHHPIFLSQKTHLSSLQGASRDLRLSYMLEDFLSVGQRWGARVHGRGDESPDHLLRAAARGDYPHSGLDQSHVRLAGGADAV